MFLDKGLKKDVEENKHIDELVRTEQLYVTLLSHKHDDRDIK